MQMLELAATAIIFVWASYCILSPMVHDGVIGKIFYIMAALGSFLDMVGSQACSPHTLQPQQLTQIAIAAVVARHFILKINRTKRAINAGHHA